MLYNQKGCCCGDSRIARTSLYKRIKEDKTKIHYGKGEKEEKMKLKKFNLKRFSGALAAALLTAAMLVTALPVTAETENMNTYSSISASTYEKIEIAESRESRSTENTADSNLPVDVTLDGEAILQGEARLINSVTYVPLRRFSEIADADNISWNGNTATATVKKGGTTLRVSDRHPYIEANGRYFYTASPIRNIEGRLYLPVRLIANAFCIDVSWDTKTRTANLKSTSRVLAKGSDFYISDDLYWLSRIISAEAGGEPLAGKIAVGNVVLNRRAHPSYPSSVYGVVFDRKHGTQFSPVAIGTIYKKPTAESIIAAKICLEGYSLDKNILFFMNPRLATSNWISNSRRFAFRIANHDFYY